MIKEPKILGAENLNNQERSLDSLKDEKKDFEDVSKKYEDSVDKIIGIPDEIHQKRAINSYIIEKDFGIKLEDYSEGEQVQFVNFLSTKTVEEVERLKEFLNQTVDENDKKNRIKSFLSLESGEISGDKIINIGENLNSTLELQKKANELFAEYAYIVDNAEKDTDKLVEMYNEIFFEKKIDRNKANSAILNKAFGLLKDASLKLGDCKEDEKNEIIIDLIKGLRREKAIKEKTINNLIAIKEKINNMIDEGVLTVVPCYGVTYQELEKMTDDREFLNKRKKASRYDAKKLKEIIGMYRDEQKESDEYIKSRWFEFERGESKEQKSEPNMTKERFSELMIGLQRLARPNDEKIKKLEELLELQTEFENIFDNLIYDKFIETNNPVLNKYQEIITEAGKIKENIKKFFIEEHDISEEEIDNIVNSLMSRAKNLLQNYTNEIAKEQNLSEDEILKKFEEQKVDVAVFTSIFKSAYQNERISFDELKGVDYQTVSSLELTEDDKKMIREVVKLNYHNKKQQADIIEKIEKSFTDKNTKWHLLTRESEEGKTLVSCVRFDEIDEENVYAATFNVGVAYRGSKLGEAMFDRVMTDEAKERKVHAVAEIGKEVTDFYINKGGFNVKEAKTNKKTGVKYYGIERYDPENDFYGTKKIKNDKELMAYYRPEAKIDDLIKTEHYILVKKEGDNIDKIYNEVNKILNSGYVITRTIRDKENYLVFEKMTVKDLKEVA